MSLLFKDSIYSFNLSFSVLSCTFHLLLWLGSDNCFMPHVLAFLPLGFIFPKCHFFPSQLFLGLLFLVAAMSVSSASVFSCSLCTYFFACSPCASHFLNFLWVLWNHCQHVLALSSYFMLNKYHGVCFYKIVPWLICLKLTSFFLVAIFSKCLCHLLSSPKRRSLKNKTNNNNNNENNI